MHTETHFVKEYGPLPEAIVELKNGRFVDVVNGRFFDPSVRVMIEGTRVRAMPGVGGEPTDIMPDYTIDLQGKTVMPGLCNTHCHVSMVAPTMFPSLKDARIGKMYGQKQIEKNMSECLIHGIFALWPTFLCQRSIIGIDDLACSSFRWTRMRIR